MCASNLLVAAGCLAHCDYLSSSQCLSLLFGSLVAKIKAIQEDVKAKRITFKTDKDIVREVIQSTNRGHETGVGRLLPGTSSGSSISQPASGYCTQEEADRLRKENEELKKAVQSQQLEWQKFVNHFNAHQTDGYHPTFEHGSTSQIVHGDDLDIDGTCDGDGSGSLDGDGSGSLDGDSDDDSNDACDEETSFGCFELNKWMDEFSIIVLGYLQPTGIGDFRRNGVKIKEGGSILEILEEMITVGQTMGFSMEGLGSKAKKDWIKELISKHKVSFLSIQETKMESVSAMEVKFLWGNYFFDHIISEASGNSGGILCAWDTNFFKKDHHTISDNFIALYGTWIPNNQKLLIISVYAPQSVSSKRMLWSYLESLITSWNGESLIMGDFNEVRCIEERWGSVFNSHGANAFNSFISNSGLNDIQLEGFSFTWVHPSATKMSKLDRFLMSNGLLSAFPLISAICLDRHLSDHRPILLKEVFSDFGPTPFRFYHSCSVAKDIQKLICRWWNLDVHPYESYED
ncbi:RNA-directed DNA polymerase, eukaryota [Tanacetum coccineum]